MRHNIFQFGNTFWIQKNSVAMGISYAVNYAFLYMGILEILELLQDFAMWMPFFARFIDDGIGIWLITIPGSTRAWRDFNQYIKEWGDLRWTNTGHLKQLCFLYISITISCDNTLKFKTYCKEVNLHLYIPTHSFHSPDIIRSIIFSRVRAYFLHNTHQKDFVYNCYLLAHYLKQRWWQWHQLAPHFTAAEKILQSKVKLNLLEYSIHMKRGKQETSSTNQQ